MELQQGEASRRKKISDCLSSDEREFFRTASDSVALAQVAANYLIIVFAFALFGLWPNPLTFVLSALLLGGRFVGLGILNHDAAHNSLFRTRRWNRSVARWLFSGPTLIDHDTYREGHLAHHRNAGSLDDEDNAFVRSYPVEPASMRRKFTRDLIGRTGLRDNAYLLAMTIKNSRWRCLVVHALMFGALYAAGMPYAYALWWVAAIFVVPLSLRIRVMGEHGNVPNLLHRDAREHSRTTQAGWIARTLVSPNYVNYHCEHHFFANVPGYKLPALHKLLKSRGFYDAHPGALASSYLEVVRACIGDRVDRPDLGGIARGKASMANMA